LARATWWAVTLLYGAMFIVGLPFYYERLVTVCDPGVCATANWWVLSSAEALALDRWNLSLGLYAAFVLAWEALLAAVFLSIGLLLFRRQSRERIAYLTSLALGVAGFWIVPNAPHALLNGGPAFVWVDTLLWLAAVPAIAVIVFLLPDGQFTPRWNRWFALGFCLTLALDFTLTGLGLRASTADDPAIDMALVSLVFIAVGVYGQVYRYQHVATLTQRQQLKWVAFGGAGWFAGILAYAVFVSLVSIPPGGAQLAVNLAGVALINLSALLLPLALGFAILRYRLWDIDLIIRRTLLYSSLSAALILAYFGSVLMLQSVFAALTGESRNALVTVLSTLAIAALFGPLRGRIQVWIDRRFYRRKYDAARTLAAFGAQARDVVELEQLTSQLVRVVDETMQPTHVGLWVRASNTRGARE
jgi:hypothetical protein